MIFAIDVGNTNIVCGCLDNDRIYFVSRISTDPFKTEDQYAVEIKDILGLYGVNPLNIDGAIISSVVPPLSATLFSAVEKITGKQPLEIGPGIKTGLNIRIDNPAQLGSDLVVSAVAVLAEYPLPAIILDLGTATTISVIAKNGDFLGGAIVPGVRVSLDAVTKSTSQLPKISLDAPKCIIGTNTIDSMKAGVVYGNASMLDGMVRRIEKEIGGKTAVIATGGISRFIIPYCETKIVYDGDLMLKGLRIIYNKNI